MDYVSNSARCLINYETKWTLNNIEVEIVQFGSILFGISGFLRFVDRTGRMMFKY